MKINLFKFQRLPEYRLILFCILGWVLFFTFSSCAIFRSEKTDTSSIGRETPGSQKTAGNFYKVTPGSQKAPEVTLSREVLTGSESTGSTGPQPDSSKKKDVVTASLTPWSSVKTEQSLKDPFKSLTFSSSPNLFLDDMDPESLKKVIANQLEAMESIPDYRRFRLGNTQVTAAKLKETLKDFRELLDKNLSLEEFSREIRKNFVIHEAARWKNRKALFTGYYTPVIPASRVRTKEYVYPIYGMPDKFPGNRINYHKVNASYNDYGFHMVARNTLTRGDIDGKNLLSNKNLEIAWLKDDLERFFLHIQGSGVLEYEDGSLENVQYMGSNSYPYKSVGKMMIRDRVITEGQGSMQGIKKFFKENPRQAPKYLYKNKRYIFFHHTHHLPKGSGGGEVVAGRSIATDKSLYPAGALAFIIAKKPVLGPDSKIVGWKMFSRFVLDQDTGSAIKGPGRADLYFGTGEEAGEAAGHYMQRGKLFYLVKK